MDKVFDIETFSESAHHAAPPKVVRSLPGVDGGGGGDKDEVAPPPLNQPVQQQQQSKSFLSLFIGSRGRARTDEAVVVPFPSSPTGKGELEIK
jgi:hypothetical protein